jgi:colicin import membrane protein
MRAQGRERWLPIVLSVLVHGSILAALGWGWWTYRKPPQAVHTLAIEGTVVRAAAPKPVVAEPVAAPVPTPTPPAPAQAAPPPPAPSPDLERLKAEQQQAAKAAQERQAAVQRAEEQATAEREARKRAEAEAAQAAKVEADKQAKAEADRQAKLAADKRAAAEKQELQNEINGQLAAEKRLSDARANGQQDQYKAMIKSHVERQWIKPPGIPAQMECDVDVHQVPGGEVTAVHFSTCSASAVVRQSIEDAIYRASPLPAPPTADLFVPVVTLAFVGSE